MVEVPPEQPWTIAWTKRALKDRAQIQQSPWHQKAKTLVAILKDDPYQTPPAFERLKGDLSGAISRRINVQHRLVYQVLEEEHAVKILSMWSHY
jgi:Txe/YoeB family toxin of toxin-antitoxin system